MAERRMLWKSISRSKKVNKLLKTWQSKLLYTWAISHFDREGLQEADSYTLKATVVPLVNEITTENIDQFIFEIGRAGLWEIFEGQGDCRYIRDPVFFERQTIHPHEAKSQIINKIKGLKPLSFTCNDNDQPCHDNSTKKKELNRKNRIELKENSKKIFESLKALASQIEESYLGFNPWEAIQKSVNEGYLIEDIEPALKYMSANEVDNAWGCFEHIIKAERHMREIREREEIWTKEKMEETRSVAELIKGIGKAIPNESDEIPF